MYSSSNYFHIGINGTDIDTGGGNGPLLVFLLIQNRNNPSPSTFSFSSLGFLISSSSFPQTAAAAAAKHTLTRAHPQGKGEKSWALVQQMVLNVCSL